MHRRRHESYDIKLELLELEASKSGDDLDVANNH